MTSEHISSPVFWLWPPLPTALLSPRCCTLTLCGESSGPHVGGEPWATQGYSSPTPQAEQGLPAELCPWHQGHKVLSQDGWGAATQLATSSPPAHQVLSKGPLVSGVPLTGTPIQAPRTTPPLLWGPSSVCPVGPTKECLPSPSWPCPTCESHGWPNQGHRAVPCPPGAAAHHTSYCCVCSRSGQCPPGLQAIASYSRPGMEQPSLLGEPDGILDSAAVSPSVQLCPPALLCWCLELGRSL